MKKLIMMLSLLALVGILGGVELWYSYKTYSETLELLYLTADSIEENEYYLDNPETISLTEETNRMWEKSKKPLMMLVNHNLIRYTDEKFVSLLEQVQANNYQDAIVTVNVLTSYMKDLLEENKPTLTNIF